MQKMNEYQTLTHSFEPVYNQDSRILILGTFPSIKSRANHFYYGHPQNRFWKLLASLRNAAVPETVEQKKAFLLREKIAIWDVVASCDIIGSSDSSIKNVVPADLSVILDAAPISNIYANGAKAYQLYQKYAYPDIQREITKLPSTSPANAACSLEKLKEAWGSYADICRSKYF